MADRKTEEKSGAAALCAQLSEHLRAKPGQTALQLAALTGATKQRVQQALYHSGQFEKSEASGAKPRWSLRPGCLAGCGARRRFRVGSTCVHLGDAEPTDEQLGTLLRAIQAFSGGAVVADPPLEDRIRQLS
jgi:hypothetical protein